MTYKKTLTILLPGYGWEDFPIDESPKECQAYLTAAAVAYHPSVVSAMEAGPEWESVQVPPQLEQDLKGGLFLVGTEFYEDIDEDWIAMAEEAGAEILTVEPETSVQTLLETVLQRVDPASVRTFSREWIDDLMAVGFALLQVELITRRVQYMGNLDLYSINEEVRRLVRSLVEGDEADAREHLESAYDRLVEAREYQYPIDNYQFDMTLVAPTTLGESLTEELATQRAPINLLITGELITRLAERHPETLARIAERCRRADDATGNEGADEDESDDRDEERHLAMGLSEKEQAMVTVLGGPWAEMPGPLMNQESILADLQRGFEAYEKHLRMRPAIYARRLSGFTPMLPQILRGLGMAGVVHVGLGGQKLPGESQSRIVWGGHGEQAIEAFSDQPVDVTDSTGFLTLPDQLGEVFEEDESPTVAFVHWPNRSSIWYEHLRRIACHSSLLGQAIAADRYFQETSNLGHKVIYPADRYVSCFLRDVHHHDGRDPISRWVRYHGRLLRVQAIRTVAMMAELAGTSTVALDPGREMLDRINDLVLHPDSEQESELDSQLAERIDAAVACFASGIAGKDVSKGTLLINPTPTVKSAGEVAIEKVPGFGFAWASADSNEPDAEQVTSEHSSDPQPKRSFFQRFRRPEKEPPLAEENVLRNEFFEVTLDPTMGSIRAVHDYRTRGNRLGQQIALRMGDLKEVVDEARGGNSFWSEDCEERLYTIMAADSQEVLCAGPRQGRIRTQGRLVDRHGKTMAGFSQTITVERGSRILGLEIELDPHHHPSGSPWDAYYAVRFAWGSAMTEIYRSVGFASEPCDVDRIESPYFVDLRTDKMQTTILTGGLPFHRRVGFRKLDTLLVVREETARHFRLGIAIDAPHPTQVALGQMMPILAVDDVACRDASTGWLLHLDRPNVVATDLMPIREDGRLVGMVVRLLETEGAPTVLRLQACRSIGTAEVTDFLGNTVEKLTASGQAVEVTLNAREWKQLRLYWI